MKKVWIDAGHGGKDPGAVGNGLQEKDIALAVSLAIKDKLENEYDGVQVLLSRSADVFLELKDRTNKANSAGADILVSIHCNAGGGAGGFETFRHPNSLAPSSALQNVVHSEIMSQLKPLGINDRGQKTGNLHMVRETKMPSILTENLFIDVKSDADKLKQSKVIDAIVNGHVLGIVKYLGLQNKTPAANKNEVAVLVNGKKVDGVKLIDNVTYVPLRAVSESLGATVKWDNATKTATITK